MPTEKSNVLSYFQIDVCVLIYLILHSKNKFDVSKKKKEEEEKKEEEGEEK